MKKDYLVPTRKWAGLGIVKYSVVGTCTPYRFHIILCDNPGELRNSNEFIEVYGPRVEGLDAAAGLTIFNRDIQAITILLYSASDVGVMAHEAFHGAKYFLSNSVLQVPLADESDELFAYTLQTLFQEILNTMWEGKVITINGKIS